ncbi:FLX-like 1 protein [Nymphaea thermarum]|nr:FLX-like 1 protein [Nymphaea thermarum]
MAGRSRVPPMVGLTGREFPVVVAATRPGVPLPILVEEMPPAPGRSLRPVAAAAALAEERLAAQHREIQALLLDNQRLAATHVALKQELSAAQQELRRASHLAAASRAEGEARSQELFEKTIGMEAELRALDNLRAEMQQVRADVQKLHSSRQELDAQADRLTQDLARARADVQQVSAIRAEVETMHQELQRGSRLFLIRLLSSSAYSLSTPPILIKMRLHAYEIPHHFAQAGSHWIPSTKSAPAMAKMCPGDYGWSQWKQIPLRPNAHVDAINSLAFVGRAAVEYEKKIHAENMEQSQAMEKNMISMAREVEKLRAELANAEKRALAAAAAAAAANPEYYACLSGKFCVWACEPSDSRLWLLGPGYGGNYGPDIRYGGNTYADGYAMHQGGVESIPQYGTGGEIHAKSVFCNFRQTCGLSDTMSELSSIAWLQLEASFMR